MYEQLAASYVLDPANQKFLTASNPWALHSITERLLEAADRKLWDLALTDARVMAALSRAMSREAADLGRYRYY